MIRKTSVIFSALVLCALLATAAQAKDITVRGKLQKTVEAGGWLIVVEKQKYLILNADKFRGEKWFAEGTDVEATGEEKKGVMTIYMEGTPFEVHSMHPTNKDQAATETMDTDPGLTRVLVTGDSIVQARPDTAIVTISVVTQSKRALEAQQENANRSETVVRALKDIAGPSSDIKTSGYSLQPQRTYRENQPPTIIGYEARNTVTVTLNNLAKVGPVIDAASQAGANDVAGIAFTLRQDRPARNQALAQATRTAVGKAQVIAQALGGRVAHIVEVEEAGFVRPRPLDQMQTMNAGIAGRAMATPIEVGSLDITSRVQLVAMIEK